MKLDYDEDLSIDLTPLIDVIFMLLIFFIMTTTFTKPVLDIMLPSSEISETNPEKSDELLIAVNSVGEIYYGETLLTIITLKEILANHPDKLLNLHIDQQAPFKSFIEIIDIAKTDRNGKFIISTERSNTN